MKRIKYRCHRVDKIIVDGILEKEWKKAENLEFFIPVTMVQPSSETSAKLLYDNDFLYIGFFCHDQDIKATYTKRDSPTWQQDVVEVFLKTGENISPYYEFEFSPIKTVFDAFLPGPEKLQDIFECAKWNCEGLKVETKICGTLNDSSDTDQYWSIEIAIPFKGLPTLKGKQPEKGDKWLFHLARYDYSAYLPSGRELSSTARFTVRNFHFLDDWMYLEFQ